MTWNVLFVLRGKIHPLRPVTIWPARRYSSDRTQWRGKRLTLIRPQFGIRVAWSGGLQTVCD